MHAVSVKDVYLQAARYGQTIRNLNYPTSVPAALGRAIVEGSALGVHLSDAHMHQNVLAYCDTDATLQKLSGLAFSKPYNTPGVFEVLMELDAFLRVCLALGENRIAESVAQDAAQILGQAAKDTAPKNGYPVDALGASYLRDANLSHLEPSYLIFMPMFLRNQAQPGQA